MNPHISITSPELTRHISKRGNPYFRQCALFVRGDGPSSPLELMVDEGNPHAPGQYALHPRSFKPSKYGVELDVVLGDRLDKVAAATTPKAA